MMKTMHEETPTGYPHIVINATGNPVIEGTGMKVEYVAVAHLQHGWSPQEIHWQFPDLSLAEIHAALSYYYDHKTEIDRQEQESLAWLDEQRQKQAYDPFFDKIRQHRLAQASGT